MGMQDRVRECLAAIALISMLMTPVSAIAGECSAPLGSLPQLIFGGLTVVPPVVTYLSCELDCGINDQATISASGANVFANLGATSCSSVGVLPDTPGMGCAATGATLAAGTVLCQVSGTLVTSLHCSCGPF